ncbi:MAG TPA: hypothetical protein VM939_07150 [Gemmatimonadaceae bacterium]|nr:hypothetical protein [Gemmatimonadaceae bacterium]
MKLQAIGVVILAAVLLPRGIEAQGQDQYVWGVAGGVAITTSDLRDAHPNGANATLVFGIGGLGSPVGVRFDFMYNQFEDQEDGTLQQGKARITALTGNLVFNIYGDEKRLYGIIGVGGYGYNPDGAGTRNANDFGFNAGLGVWLPGLRGTFIEARYHNFYRALPDQATGETGKRSAKFVPITVGFLF